MSRRRMDPGAERGAGADTNTRSNADADPDADADADANTRAGTNTGADQRRHVLVAQSVLNSGDAR